MGIKVKRRWEMGKKCLKMLKLGGEQWENTQKSEIFLCSPDYFDFDLGESGQRKLLLVHC